MATKEEVIAKLQESDKVDYLTYMQDRSVVLVMTRDQALVEALRSRGASARWYDRVPFSTQKGGDPDMQCEVVLHDDRFQYEVAA